MFVNDIRTTKQKETAKVINSLQSMMRTSIITLKYYAHDTRAKVEGEVSVSVKVAGGLSD
jgi:hypothetical protein